MARIIFAASFCVLLAGCGGIGSSALNPATWFRASEPEPEALVPAGALERRDPRPLVEEVTGVVLETVPGGAVLRARGRVTATGWFAPDLVAEPQRAGPGVLVYSFRAAPPPDPVPPASAASRAVVAGVFLSEGELAGVRQIQVFARTNVRAAR
ncbi:MAG: hypothetical protein QNJ13_04265 [Paracoccaceae bacterium]|nr:hypothetical protein [Paracoccaceae bacterium]